MDASNASSAFDLDGLISGAELEVRARSEGVGLNSLAWAEGVHAALLELRELRKIHAFDVEFVPIGDEEGL